jgi:hypothetical protein
MDIDCYNLGYDPHWVAEKINLEVFQETVPIPNFIIFSGRGLVCVWLIEPVPGKVLPLWKALQNHFYKELEYVGADKKSIDPSRVFRIAGSINSKNGNRVEVEYRHDYRYVLRELQAEYLPELSPIRPRKQASKSKIVHLHSIRNLYYARLLDIVKLAKLRDYDLRGYREVFCFLYRYWSCCLSDDSAKALEQMLDFNNDFKDPLPRNEAIKATNSAEKAWKIKDDEKANEDAKANGYPGAGYNLKNWTIIHWLDITSEEQEHLKTIIDGNEKRRRKRNRDKMSFRKKHGSVSRAEYLRDQQEKTNDKLWQLKVTIEKHPKFSNIKLAKHLNISESYVRKLKQKL